MLKENRSLDRGIEILETLAREGAMSLADLHRATGLPKSTLRRLLQTLIARKIVRRSLADKLYRTLVVFPDISGEVMPKGMLHISEAAIPRALALTKEIGWPSDIHIRETRAMRIIDNTRHASTFHVERGQINQRVSHFGSATGLACLAEMKDAEIATIYEAFKPDLQWGPVRFGLDLAGLMARIEQVRQVGYAERLSAPMSDPDWDTDLRAIAVAIKARGRVVGGLSVLWLRPYKPVEEFARLHLEALQTAAAEINATLDAVWEDAAT
ncbi:transcriptional regulator, IclR family [Ruegeria sp. TM1040]|jgi:IclR family mhp operon transcriptional activator|uniref:helix-turn-helix domain-containing protein n=1 Tax=Ruegeria sp. (strain TM1040) TaxID=292414 RepID=UPI0000462F94|nr:helix-turn-helix domain-containing protein [Ruegeria sp. TM1040]ABF64844.1 transcriptional regulator, IclR family [Ruegeria sp. TM1040]